MQTGFRFTFHHQAALKEQGVRILASPRQGDEVFELAAQRDIRRTLRTPQAGCRDLERQRHRHIIYVETKALARQLIQTSGNRLAAQRMIHGERDGMCVHDLGREPQQTRNDISGLHHGDLQHRHSAHSCHAGVRSGLIHIKRGTR